MRNSPLNILFYLLISRILASCATTKHVPDDSFLLDEVKITTDNKNIKPSNLTPYLRQIPNAKWFSLFKTQLSAYSLSGKDSTKWINGAVRKRGDAPVLDDESEALRTEEELRKAV